METCLKDSHYEGVSVLNILVTGGAGFIGSHLTDELIWTGHADRLLLLII